MLLYNLYVSYKYSEILIKKKKGFYDKEKTQYECSCVCAYWDFSYFDKNTLGDIVAIRDESGNIVARYEYDAWGNITYQSGSMADINPFRYRGYYYDNETGFYYLQTRYYDPSICRFINADNYEVVAQLSYVSGQLNMYAYCGNNPIMYTDETGELAISAGLYFGGMTLFFLLELLYIETTTHAISSSIVYITQQVNDGFSSLGNYLSAKKKGSKSKDKNKDKNPDPFARPDQKKQGRERKAKARLKPNFEQRNGRRRGPQPLKHHTPGRDHKKYLLIMLFGSELILDNWLED